MCVFSNSIQKNLAQPRITCAKDIPERRKFPRKCKFVYVCGQMNWIQRKLPFCQNFRQGACRIRSWNHLWCTMSSYKGWCEMPKLYQNLCQNSENVRIRLEFKLAWVSLCVSCNWHPEVVNIKAWGIVHYFLSFLQM